MNIIVNTTPMALWYEIIHDAESNCAISLKDELESYLVLMLVRYTNKPEMAKQIMASELLHSIHEAPTKRNQALQEVGDKCLLFSGLFPKLAEKRLVKIGYYVNIGQSAYASISNKNTDIFNLLTKNFVAMMDVLQSVRRHSKEYPDLLPLQAYELWNETGSQRALSVLKQYTRAIPLINREKDS